VCGNGLITKDKFCYSRQTKLPLTWSRYEVWLKRKAKISQNTPPEPNKKTGGENEASMACEATNSRQDGWTEEMGSGLPTAIRMADRDPGAETSRAQAKQDRGGKKQ
jgi:hypothetical protein